MSNFIYLIFKEALVFKQPFTTYKMCVLHRMKVDDNVEVIDGSKRHQMPTIYWSVCMCNINDFRV